MSRVETLVLQAGDEQVLREWTRASSSPSSLPSRAIVSATLRSKAGSIYFAGEHEPERAMTINSPSGVVALVTAFHPDSRLGDLVQSALRQCSRVVVIDNTPTGQPGAASVLDPHELVQVELTGQNLGLAGALQPGSRTCRRLRRRAAAGPGLRAPERFGRAPGPAPRRDARRRHRHPCALGLHCVSIPRSASDPTT